MKRNRSLEEKLEAIGLVVQGESAHSVSERFHLGHHVLYEWLEVYRNEGIAGLKARHAGVRKPLSYGKKCQIIQEYRERELTLYQICARHGISASTLSKLVSDVERDGTNALKRKRTESRKPCMSRMKRLSKEEFEKENERLRKENERLRLENLLLKKVRALVEEREARNRATGRRPSMD